MIDSPHQKIQALAKGRESITTSEIVEIGVSNQAVTRLLRRGALEKVRRGVYRLPNSPITENHDLVNAMKGAPKAVVVLISALHFHGIGTQQAHEVWIQLPMKAHAPRIEWPPIRIIRTSVNALFTEGVEEHRLSGEMVRITTPARTVADCFKHRNKLGIDVCVEALRETLRERKSTIGEIGRMGRLLRAGKVMRPYLEAMI